MGTPVSPRVGGQYLPAPRNFRPSGEVRRLSPPPLRSRRPKLKPRYAVGRVGALLWDREGSLSTYI